MNMPKKVEIISVIRDYDGFFKIDKATFRYEKFNGEMSEPVTRLVLERGNSVGVLLYNEETDSVILVKQFRYPAYINGGPGWILEIVAGMINEGDVISVARSELLEEAGYEAEDLEFIGKFYVSPGGSSEIVYLYWSRAHHKKALGGGKSEEHEDIELVEIKLDDAMEMIKSGEICDAKTIIAIQWLKIRQMEQSRR